MSLQVWLPLNGSIENRGLLGNFIQGTTPSYTTEGKIGKALTTGSLLMSSEQTAKVLNNNEVSFCFWIYINAATGSSPDNPILFGVDHMWENDNRKFSIFTYPTVNDLHLSWQNDSANNTFIADVYSNAMPSYKWTHIAITYKNPTCTLYINGEKKATYSGTSSSSSFAYQTPVINSASFRRLNDFRIYDHCLSAKEVKEISKGLICHYKLNNSGFGGENLILESRSVISGGDASGITSAYMNDGSLKVVATSGNGSWRSCGFSKDSNSNVGSKLSVGDTYTISLDVKIEEGNSLPSLFINNGNAYRRLQPVNGKIVTNSWFRAYYTSTWNEPGTSYGNISIHLSFGGIIGTFYFKNFKLEKGSKPTQWCPSPLDDNTLGLNSTTESDCSGLSNNGTKIGGLTPSTSPASIRYESCYNFDGNTGSIQIPNLATLVPNGEFTMNCWIYHDNTWSSKGYETILGGPSGFELEAKNGSTNSPVLWAHSWGGSTTTYELNKWNMITMTRNASESKFYINGELKITGSAGTIPSGNYFIGAWRTSSEQNYKGRISDFRIYSNVLSVDDIKELYTTSASVDKNGNMYAYEFKEE